MKKPDLYSSCNEQNTPEKEFTSLFCNRCKNRNCVRAGWAFSNWDERISTQADRFLHNPNIVLQSQSSRWEGLPNLETLPHQGIIEVWGANTPKETPKNEPPKKITQEILTSPPLVTSVGEPLKRQLNVSPKEYVIGGSHSEGGRSSGDEWAVPPKTVKVGSTFKMGG